jgi:hypothetical protein
VAARAAVPGVALIQPLNCRRPRLGAIDHITRGLLGPGVEERVRDAFVDEDRVAGADAHVLAVVSVAELQHELPRLAVADLVRSRVPRVAIGSLARREGGRAEEDLVCLEVAQNHLAAIHERPLRRLRDAARSGPWGRPFGARAWSVTA